MLCLGVQFLYWVPAALLHQGGRKYRTERK
nr:MAG TPA: hypothetical protein [Caudoviricetes sp.]